MFLRGFDQGVREHLRDELTKKGIDLRFNANVARIDKRADGTLAATLEDGSVVETDCVFFATGRRAMLDKLGLENTAVRIGKNGFIEVDDEFRTAEPSILAIGDVIGRVPLTPVALAEGMAVVRRLFRPAEYRKVDYALIPTAVFSLPNIGTVGLTTEQAREAGHEVKLYESRFRPMKLTLTESQEKTLMKLVVDAKTDRVLGVHGRARCRRDRAGHGRGAQGRGDQAGVRRHHRHPSDRCRGIRDDARWRSGIGPANGG